MADSLETVVVLVVSACLLVLFLWGLRRWNRGARRIHADPPGTSWRSRPAPGQIWWAAVPFADGTGSKVRPCLVIRTHAAGLEVLKITSQDKSHRPECVRISTAGWDKKARKDSWLDLVDVHWVADQAVERLAGPADGDIWHTVARRHRTGWVYSARELTR